MRESHPHTFSQIRLGIGPFSIAFLGTRREQVTLARLRLGHSELAESSARFDPSLSPMCPCGVIESVPHFLLECPLHSAARAEMFSETLQAAGLAALPSDSLQLLSLLLGTAPTRIPRAASRAIVASVFAFVTRTSRSV